MRVLSVHGPSIVIGAVMSHLYCEELALCTLTHIQSQVFASLVQASLDPF